MIHVESLGVTQCNHPLTAGLKDAPNVEARPHHSAFLQSFSNYRGEEGGTEEAIPNPAIKLQGIPGSLFPTLEGM